MATAGGGTSSAPSMKSSNSSLAATAMAIAGRSLRPCDVCGRERAKWYCKADEAYLCEHCDGSVHGANAVSQRHERLRLGPNGMPMKNVRRVRKFEPGEDESRTTAAPAAAGSMMVKDEQCCPPRKKPRSSRCHPSSKEIAKVKPEPKSPRLNFDPKALFDDEFADMKHDELSRQVPIFEPLVEDFDDNSLGFAVPCATAVAAAHDEEEDMCFSAPDECDLDGFLDSEADLCDMDGIIAASIDDLDGIVDFAGVLGCSESKVFTGSESYGIDFSEMAFRSSSSNDASEGEVCDTPDGAMSDFCAKVKMEECDELDKIKLEVDEMLGFAFNATTVKEEQVERKITLKLNYEDVLNAWSDRGPFWTEGPRPQTVPDDSSFDPASTLDSGMASDFCMESTEAGEAIGQVPVVNFGEDRMTARGGREARVMRYREKRRTRLFSKKIRYEVRKLNAERRPRLKGRFVKRNSGTLMSSNL